MSRNILEDNYSIPEGNYHGRLPQYEIFVKVTKDTAIAEWILIDKSPRGLYTDTLSKFRNDNNNWQGNFSSIINKRKRIYIECPNFYYKNEMLKTRIRLNNDCFDDYYDLIKGITFLGAKAREYKGNREVYDSLSSKYNLEYRMTHKELLIKYEEFMQELLLIDKEK